MSEIDKLPPTPITDEARDRCSGCGLEFVPVDVAERLERGNRALGANVQHGGPCPDGDACPDARRYGSVHATPSAASSSDPARPFADEILGIIDTKAKAGKRSDAMVAAIQEACHKQLTAASSASSGVAERLREVATGMLATGAVTLEQIQEINSVARVLEAPASHASTSDEDLIRLYQDHAIIDQYKPNVVGVRGVHMQYEQFAKAVRALLASKSATRRSE